MSHSEWMLRQHTVDVAFGVDPADGFRLRVIDPNLNIAANPNNYPQEVTAALNTWLGIGQRDKYFEAHTKNQPIGCIKVSNRVMLALWRAYGVPQYQCKRIEDAMKQEREDEV